MLSFKEACRQTKIPVKSRGATPGRVTYRALNPHKPLYTIREVAALLPVSISTLQKMPTNDKGRIPILKDVLGNKCVPRDWLIYYFNNLKKIT